MSQRFTYPGVWLVFAGLCAAAAALPDAAFQATIDTLQPARLRRPIDVADSPFVAAVIAQREPTSGTMDYAPLTVVRARRLIVALAVIFLVVGLLIAVWRTGRFRGGPFDFFPIALATIWLTHIVCYRIAVGAGFGFTDDPSLEQISTGFLLNDVDNLNYLSWAVQSQHGRNFFSVLFTTEPSAEIFFNPYFWFIGRAAAWTGLALPGVLNAAGLVGAVGTILCVYAMTTTAGFSKAAARWAAVFTAYSSGLTGLTTLLHLEFGVPLWMGCDALFIDSTTFSPFLCFPYQSFCFFLTALIILLLLRAERAVLERARRSKIELFGAFLLEAFLVASHPYEGMMILGSFGSSFLLSLVRRDDRSVLAFRFRICVLLAAASIPPALYYMWVMKHPVYREFAVVTLADWRPWWSWLIGYACILPVALVGCLDVYRGRRRGAYWLADWTTVVGFLLIVVNIAATTRFSAGLYLPFCVTAGHGWMLLLARTQAVAIAPLRIAAKGAVGVVGILFFFTSFGLLLYGYQPYTYDGGLKSAADALRTRAGDSIPTLLCDVRTARTLVAIGPARVYAGHWSQTPQYFAKRDALVRAGITAANYPGAPQDPPTAAAFDELTSTAKADFLLVADDVPAATFAAASQRLTPLEQYGRWRLYQVRR